MADFDNNRKNDPGSGELLSWLVVAAGFAIFPPIGLILLFLRLNGVRFFGSRSRSSRKASSQSFYYAPNTAGATQSGSSVRRTANVAPGMQGVAPTRQRKNVDPKRGKAMTIWGGIIAGLFGFASFVSFPQLLLEGSLFKALANMTPLLGFFGLGLVLAGCGIQRNKKAKRFRKYLSLIGKRESISIASLAQAMPVSVKTACADLQEMLDEGYLPAGYLDMGSGRLLLTEEGLREEPVEEEAPAPAEEEQGKSEDDILLEIKQVNDAIADPVMSRKIDRIGEITSKILDYQRRNPSKAGQLRSFLNYYLPTTLKILKAYGQMEAQGIEGQNITAAKARIEGMMDKVVEGFEKQLDRLFQDDAMDITSDVAVLERMLDNDGLSDGGQTLTMGGGGGVSTSALK